MELRLQTGYTDEPMNDDSSIRTCTETHQPTEPGRKLRGIQPNPFRSSLYVSPYHDIAWSEETITPNLALSLFDPNCNCGGDDFDFATTMARRLLET